MDGKEGDVAMYLIDLADLQEGEKLGNGAFGIVAGGLYLLPLPNGKKLEVPGLKYWRS